MTKGQLSNVTIATELYAVQEQREIIEAREKELKDALLASLKTQGVSFVRLENGTSFTRSHRETLKVKDEAKAVAWAEKNYCMKIDTAKAMKILRRELKMPSFFTRAVGEDYLTVKRGEVEL
jgi:hypothetical protein